MSTQAERNLRQIALDADALRSRTEARTGHTFENLLDGLFMAGSLPQAGFSMGLAPRAVSAVPGCRTCAAGDGFLAWLRYLRERP
jgi:hypothetical protein